MTVALLASGLAGWGLIHRFPSQALETTRPIDPVAHPITLRPDPAGIWSLAWTRPEAISCSLTAQTAFLCAFPIASIRRVGAIHVKGHSARRNGVARRPAEAAPVSEGANL